MKEQILKELKNKSEVINDSLWYVNPDDVNNALDQTREETIREVEKRIVKYIDENKKKNFNNREFIGYEILDLIN